MAVTQQPSKLRPDAAPLWLPRHDAVVVDQAAARPPDVVQGYSLKDRVIATFLGSPWKIATMVSTALAVGLFFSILPSLFGAGVGGFFKIAFYQAWTLGLMLIATARVRTVSTGAVTRYWLAGLFTVAIVAYFLNGPLSNLADRSEVWVTPVLEELLKAAPLAVALFMGRRVWRHPGLSDLMLLGFAVGGGYALHEEALWERAAVSGFEANAGIFLPSIFQPDGIFVVGHAVWTSLIGLAIGLIMLHRHQALAVVAAATLALISLGDHMAINDAEGTLGWIRQLLFNGKLVALVFLVGVAAAVFLDHRRLAATGSRDHLFPNDRSHWRRPVDTNDEDLLGPLLISRYRRLRNGVHTTVDATLQQWPPRSEDHAAPLAELARLGRAADIAVGPGTSSYGWAPDPENPQGMRYVGPEGFTSYAAGDQVIDAAPQALEQVAPAADTDGEDADRVADGADELSKAELKEAKRAAKLAPSGPTTVTMSTPKARAQATGSAVITRAGDYWQYFALGVVAVVLFVVVRLITAGDPSTELIETALSLPYATNSPALIRGLLGAVAAGVAIRGRNPVELGAGWEVGPGVDSAPHSPYECEA